MIAPTVDPQTRSALVYVDLPPARAANAPFKAGMFASGEFELGTSDALTVPQQAVVVRDGFSYVFRLNPDQRVSQIKVQAGPPPGRPHRSGRRPHGRHALVVVSGAGFLNDGDLVRNVQARPRRRRSSRQRKVRSDHEFFRPLDQEPDPGDHAVRRC